MFRKEAVWPSMMVGSSAPTFPSGSFPQDTSQSHPHPAVNLDEHRVAGMLEVFVPAFQDRSYQGRQAVQTMSVASLQIGTKPGSKVGDAFGVYPTVYLAASPVTLEAISQEVKIGVVISHIHNTGLFRMKRQAKSGHPVLYQEGEKGTFYFYVACQVLFAIVQACPEQREPALVAFVIMYSTAATAAGRYSTRRRTISVLRR